MSRVRNYSRPKSTRNKTSGAAIAGSQWFTEATLSVVSTPIGDYLGISVLQAFSVPIRAGRDYFGLFCFLKSRGRIIHSWWAIKRGHLSAFASIPRKIITYNNLYQIPLSHLFRKISTKKKKKKRFSLTKVVAIESGKQAAVNEKAAMRAAVAPSDSRILTMKE